MEYNSPIQTVVTEVTSRVKKDAETAIMEAVWSCGIEVNKFYCADGERRSE